MAIISKYPSEKIEQILQEVMTLLDNHEAPNDLALMILGNAATSIINDRVHPSQRQKLAESFGKVLINSVEVPKQS